MAAAWQTSGQKMDRNEQNDLVNRLEASPHLVPVHVETLRTMIAGLMDEIYDTLDTEHKMQLVAIEYRARLILDRWKLREAN